MRVVAPLPFLPGQYERASTFQGSHLADEERAAGRVLLGEFLAKSPADAFLVRLPDEVDLGEDALRARHEPLLTGPAHKPARDIRYGAAGEYVAAYSDLLIVLSDPVDRARDEAARATEAAAAHGQRRRLDVGTHGIADVKRRGLTPGRLPILPALTWADNGPVLRVSAPRRSTPAADRAPAGNLELLFPYDSRPAEHPDAPDDDPAWQAQGRREQREFARNLEEFNADPTPRDPARETGEWLAMLQPGHRRDPMLHVAIEEEPGEQPAAAVLRGELRRLGQLRRRVADANDFHDGGLKVLRVWLFALAFLAAVLLAGSEHWQYPTDPAGVVPTRREALFILSLGLTGAGLFVLRRFRGAARDRARTDYRSIAEGLRVQFYWAAGTGQSASSAYLQRQRGGLSWIRAAVASAAFPYETARRAFAELDRKKQVALLRHVRAGWLGGQIGYYAKSLRGFEDRRHAWGELSLALVWSGLVLNAVAFAVSAMPKGWLDALREEEGTNLVRFGATAAVVLAIWAIRVRRAGTRRPGPDIRESWRRFRQAPLKSCHAEAIALLSDGFPRFDGEPTLFQRVGATGLATLAVTSLALGGALHLAAAWHGAVPHEEKLLGFTKNLVLAGGLLVGLWAGVHFLTDNVRRYREMLAPFTAADRRLADHLGALETGDDDLARQALADIQALLVALGREALQENSEWLSMHRTRPIEPLLT